MCDSQFYVSETAMIPVELFWVTTTVKGESGPIALNKLNTQYTVPLDSALKRNNTKQNKKTKWTSTRVLQYHLGNKFYSEFLLFLDIQ